MKSHSRNTDICLLFIAMASAAFCIYAFFPGYIYSDVFDQYMQAVTSTYTDWHPPMLALMWRAQYLVLGNGNWFYSINFAVAAISLFVLVKRLPLYASVPVFLMVFFSPLFMGQLGFPAKDVVLSVLLLTIVALLSTIDNNRGALGGEWVLFLLIVTIAVALLSRTNAPFIVAPIIVYLTMGWRLSIRSVISAALITLIAIGVSGPINHNIFRATELRPVTSLQIFDLGGISYFTGRNHFPGPWTAKERTEIEDDCYNPLSWDNYAWGECGFVNQKARKQNLTTAWVQAIYENPVAYIKHRIMYFNEFLRFVGDFDAFRYVSWTEPGYQNQKFPGDYTIHKSYVELMGAHPRQPWHLPYIWLALSAGLLIVSAPCRNADAKLINCLSFASLAYIGAYLLVGVASDFRYVLPSSYLIIACFLLRWGRGEAIGTRATVISGGLVSISIIAVGALL
ncbi:hypothetical protein C3731_20725 [Brucella oryzae]|uniref:Glycosyltransferase RgtA/B/C/D-like domain-containing protein n=1 Tax=Brucella oryzae TaxID=335286 RepID=A0A2S7IUL4_9HYPH|nr:hypothetical protein C3731_20725 [Brucella oryzae]